MELEAYQHTSIAILGYGAEGQSTLRFLLRSGIAPEQITILDRKDIQEIPDKHIRIVSGEQYLEHLQAYDVIFKTSGIPYLPALQAVADKLITQAQFFFDHYRGNVIAITASKGKTTMSSLAYALLHNAGKRVKLVGNIGVPIFDEIDFSTLYDYVVIELSSYMLQTLKKQNFISLLGSLFPEHLDRHGSKEAYEQSKLRILQGSDINIVFNSTLSLLHSLGKDSLPSSAKLVNCGKGTAYDWNTDFFLIRGEPVFPLRDVQLLGEHNLWNISAIVALADVLEVNRSILHQTIKQFQPVRHRLQYVGTFQGIEFYDDAISTTPESTIAALEALGEKVETLLLGGLDRGYDFLPLVEKIKKSQIKQLVFFPDSGEKIKIMLNGETTHYTMLSTANMEEAVKFSYAHTSPGKICLLSTASPSYSVWKNFEEKGDLFQQWIRVMGEK